MARGKREDVKEMYVGHLVVHLHVIDQVFVVRGIDKGDKTLDVAHVERFPGKVARERQLFRIPCNHLQVIGEVYSGLW